jgi:hypothetical protein
MSAAEWLRSLTRRGDPDEIAVEAAGALAAFAEQPATLVVACRRLLAHHPESGPLWWLCSTLLTAPDPVGAAHEAGARLASDHTSERLDAALPLLDPGQVVVVAGWPGVCDRALGQRPDREPVAVRTTGTDPVPRVRRRSADQRVRVVDVWDVPTLDAGIALVAAEAFGPGRAVVQAGTGELLSALPARVPVWLVGGVGRALPPRVLDALEALALDAPADPLLGPDAPGSPVERCSLEAFDRVVTPRGVESITDAVRAIDCPIAPELFPHR